MAEMISYMGYISFELKKATLFGSSLLLKYTVLMNSVLSILSYFVFEIFNIWLVSTSQRIENKFSNIII